MKTEITENKETIKKGPFIRLTDAFNDKMILINIDAMYFIRTKADDSGKLRTSLTLRDRSVEICVKETPEQIWDMI